MNFVKYDVYQILYRILSFLESRFLGSNGLEEEFNSLVNQSVWDVKIEEAKFLSKLCFRDLILINIKLIFAAFKSEC